MRLAERHKIEQAYHDQASARERTDFYAWGALSAADDYAFGLLGDLHGKRVLDLGCGDGANAIRLARAGAHVIAIDLSIGMVAATRKRVEQAGLASAVDAQQMSAEHLGFADGSFDAILGHSVLHHTDLRITRREVHRLLKSAGKAIFLEPLDHNPLLNLFRKLTPWRRTPTEKPLSYDEIHFFGEPFSQLHHHEFYLVALAAFACIPLKNRTLFQIALNTLIPLDDRIFARWPHMRRYAWAVVLELTL
ncbi:MAG: class I SAM-dependent methyltransferase [Roseiflexaceae bacterium]|nr:class I SAM-dependent methyltransferase [Roseiflexaceae bacterium]